MYGNYFFGAIRKLPDFHFSETTGGPVLFIPCLRTGHVEYPTPAHKKLRLSGHVSIQIEALNEAHFGNEDQYDT
jgi:hypothetical protein